MVPLDGHRPAPELRAPDHVPARKANVTTADALLQVLIRFSRTLVDRSDVNDVLCELTDRVIEIVSADAAGATLADDGAQLRFLTATSPRAAELERLQEESQTGPGLDAFTSGHPVAVHDVRDETRWPGYREAARSLGIGAVLSIPMVANDRRIGALDIYLDDPRDWTDDEVDNAQVLADIAASFVVHASELERARLVNEQLERALASRIIIEQAKGVLAGEYKISVEQAFTILRGHARSHQSSLRSVAEAVVNLGLRPTAVEGRAKTRRPTATRDDRSV